MQLTLDDLRPVTGTIAERYRAWIAANPEALALFRRFAEEVRAAGLDHYSADSIVQRMRWHVTFEVKRTDGTMFKINDHFSAHLARHLVEIDPSFSGFFELRKLRAEGV